MYITAANTTGLDLNIDIYNRLESGRGIVEPTVQLTVVAKRFQLELLITINLGKPIS